MTLAGALLVALGAAYALILGGYAVGFWRVVRQRHAPPPDPLPFVSVVVPARDEAACIGRCLRSVLANDYPADRFEVIVVDDLSEDDTPERVRALMREVNAPALAAAGADEPPPPPRLRLLQMPENLARTRAHKKRAVTKGIAHARGEIILCTDADSVVPRRWIRTMATAFDPETALVSGPVLYPVGHSPARHVQALEFLGLVAVGAGAIGIGQPNLCNGANVAYRKDVFEALGGFAGIDHLTSGDDELLMQKIAYTTPWRVRFCADRRAAVLTEGAPTLRAFFEQRRRWASKGRHYPHRPLRATVGTVFAFYVALVTAALALPVAPALGPFLAASFALKTLPEFALLAQAAHRFRRLPLLAYFLPAQLVQTPYVVLMGVAGALGGYTWKGRRIDR